MAALAAAADGSDQLAPTARAVHPGVAVGATGATAALGGALRAALSVRASDLWPLEVECLVALLLAARVASTADSYAGAIAYFCKWCQRAGAAPVPASDSTLLRFLLFLVAFWTLLSECWEIAG